MNDLISRQAAIDGKITIQRANGVEIYYDEAVPVSYLKYLPSAQPEIIRCKDCKYWNSGSCECREIAVNCQDYYVGDMETEAEHFCGYAERREVTE